jgi:hypothetical protein
VLAWGASLEQAWLRLELVEHLAKIAIAAQPIGGIEPLPEDVLRSLMPARAKAGLGRAADRAVESVDQLLAGARGAEVKPVVACAPAPHAATPIVEPARRSQDVAAVVREEIVRALRETTSRS